MQRSRHTEIQLIMSVQLINSLEAITRLRPVNVTRQVLVGDVAKLLGDTQFQLVVVTDSSEAMVGVVTKTNVVRRIGECNGNACSTSAEEIITRAMTFCSSHDVLLDVLVKMEKGDFVHLPVVDHQLLPLGDVNARDSLRALLAAENYEESIFRHYVMA